MRIVQSASRLGSHPWPGSFGIRISPSRGVRSPFPVAFHRASAWVQPLGPVTGTPHQREATAHARGRRRSSSRSMPSGRLDEATTQRLPTCEADHQRPQVPHRWRWSAWVRGRQATPPSQVTTRAATAAISARPDGEAARPSASRGDRETPAARRTSPDRSDPDTRADLDEEASIRPTAVAGRDQEGAPGISASCQAVHKPDHGG